ncbi:fibronectin type III domain-containing protein [Flavobacterium branchiicola]|uniref:Fibronectin type III domain-containing protein n=1 Tax=Flavobacterium branchiicola TaxID=1114875 RepID=A0ABV9PEQ2_9FLAO|nr:fibronectin type III domain-containing protein [Flavobacterium branchiicola]MBS7253178.1 fibronectin type III domain-containing protein [Flavobacterium branchiicola]
MIKKIHLYLLLLCSLLGSGVSAQTYPVRITTQLIQPSPIYLSSYADATTINSPIKIQLVLNDLTISNRQVRLKIYFQGNGIAFNTNDFVVGAKPLYLEGGFPLQLTNVDLAPYFEYQNLLGINPNQYAQPLPEGIYNIYVEVYDFATNKKLSNKTGTTTIIFQNEPPFLNLPLNNASIMQQNIQNIVFGWTPRSINVSNVEYEFSLVEIWDKYTPVQNAFAYSPPLYTTTTRTTSLQYGINEPQLIPGRKYAWRVKAKALLGAEEIGVFKNNGYSEIFSFDYEVYCTAPLGIKTEGISENQAKVSWSGNIDNFDYQVKYREKNSGSEWYSLVTPRENIAISNLKANTTYEYTVGASCDAGKYTHSTIKEFTTLVRDEIAFQGCGIKPDPKDLANKTPLKDLFPNDVVTAGDFPIVVLHATGNNGTFSGDGYVTLPFLEKFRNLIDAADALAGENEKGESKGKIGENTRIRITFNNIGINTDFKLISGEIIASYDPNWSSMADLDGVFNDVFGSDGKSLEVKVDYEIKSAVLNPDGSTTITGTDGQITTVPKSVYNQVYTDNKGKTVTIPANGKGEPIITDPAPGGKATAANTNGVSSSGEITQIYTSNAKITFKNSTDSKYAFDVKPSSGSQKLIDTYEKIPTSDGGVYNVNYKAVSDINGPETFIATAVFKNETTKDDIVFKTNAGTVVDAKWNSDTEAEITVEQTLAFSKESIIATVKGTPQKDPKDATKTIEGKSDIAGKINVWQLEKKPVINVTILSINKASVPTASVMQDSLNSIYNKVGVEFKVTSQNVAIKPLPDVIDCGDSNIVNVYTNAQNEIKNQIESSSTFTYNDETYYIIYTGKLGGSGYDGFMPLGGQYAFVFDNKLRTAAHELGHGIFGLKHPFTDIKDSKKTNLLMDYGTGTVLSHNDWDIIHSGGWKFYGFQKSSSGAHVEVGNMEQLYANFKNTDGSLTFLTPAGKPFTIKEPISSVGFSYFDDNWSPDKSNFENTIFPIGTLKRFTLANGKTYSIAHPMKDSDIINLVGYAEIDNNGQVITNKFYIDKTSFDLKNKNIIVGIPAIEKGQLLFKVQKVTNYTDLDVAKDNYGNGPQKKIFFLKDYIKELKGAINIPSSINPLDANELYFLSEFSSDLYGINALHAIRIAYFLRNNPDLINCLGYAEDQIGKDVTLRFNKKIRDGLRASMSKNQGTTRVSIPVFYADISNNVKKDIFTSTEYLASLDELLYIYYNDLKNKGNVTTDLSLEDLSNVINGLGRECLMSNIPIKKRLEFLKQYKTWKFSDSKEDMLLELLINIRPDDIPELLKGLSANGYEILRGLYGDMSGDQEYYYTLLAIISTYVADQKKDTPEARNLNGAWKTGEDADKYVYVCKDAAHILTCNVFVTELDKTNGKITITFRDYSHLVNDKPFHRTISVDPFELIRVKFENDFDIKNTNGKDIKEGDDAIVPAIYLYWIMKQQENKTSDVQLRIALDILAIIPAVTTANPGLVLLVDAAVAGADIAFQLSPDAIKNIDNQYLKNLVNLWDDAYMTYSLGRLSGQVINGARGASKIIFNKENLAKTITRAKGIPGELKNISKSFYNIYKAIINIENISIVGTKKQIFEKVVYGTYVELTLADKCTSVNEFSLLLQNDNVIIGVNAKMANGASYAQGVSVAKVADVSGSLVLSELRTLPASYTGATKVVQIIKDISIAGKGIQTIEIISTDVGQFYARPLLIASSETNFLTSVEKNYPTIFNKIKADPSLKNKFGVDFKDANNAILNEIEDVAHFDDDYDSFVTLWKSASNSELSNALKDIDKFKSWWYPNKAKVNNEFFINQKAFELSLNSEYLEKLHLEKLPSTVRGQYWNYYKQGQWDKLEALAKEYKINYDAKNNALWPPANGGYGPLVKRAPYKNEVFDRYGGSFGDLPDGTPNLGGVYTSPMFNGKPYDFDGRALNMEKNEYDFYYKITILDPSKFEIATNRAIPWFGKFGKAEQTLFKIKEMDPVSGYPKTWSQLAKEGAVEIQVIESPSGKFTSWVGKGKTIVKTTAAIGNTRSRLKDLGLTDELADKIVSKNKSLNLSEAEEKILLEDLKNNTTLMEVVTKDPENGIEGWKIFTDSKKAFCE